MGIFKFFVIYEQLLFYSDDSAKWDSWKRSYPELSIIEAAVKLQGIELWTHSLQVKNAPPNIWSNLAPHFIVSDSLNLGIYLPIPKNPWPKEPCFQALQKDRDTR